MITFYHAMDGTVNIIRDKPYTDREQIIFEFEPRALIQWSQIWTRQSGEPVILHIGNMMYAFSRI